MIDPFQIPLMTLIGWVSGAEPHPHEFDEFNGAPFCEGKRYANGSAQGTPFQ
jgi:hypothetical protein